MARRPENQKEGLRFCGSAHCRKAVHRWIDKGTPYARLSAANCGAQRDRTEEELKQSDEDLKESIRKILERVENKNNENTPG